MASIWKVGTVGGAALAATGLVAAMFTTSSTAADPSPESDKPGYGTSPHLHFAGVPRSGSVIAGDFDYKARARREFDEASLGDEWQVQVVDSATATGGQIGGMMGPCRRAGLTIG